MDRCESSSLQTDRVVNPEASRRFLGGYFGKEAEVEGALACLWVLNREWMKSYIYIQFNLLQKYNWYQYSA